MIFQTNYHIINKINYNYLILDAQKIKRLQIDMVRKSILLISQPIVYRNHGLLVCATADSDFGIS